LIKEAASITHTHFSPSSPHTLALSSSARVQIYHPSSRTLAKTISRFKDTVLCAEFRDDGKLLLASDKSGAIQVFDLSSRAILRSWTPEETHARLQVTKVKWLGLPSVVSVGDDKTVKLWDITQKPAVTTFSGHTDYVRSLTTSGHLIFSGSLDGTAKLWDPRVSTEIATFCHGESVYAVQAMRGATMFLTGGGSGVKVWDMTAGRECPVKEMWNHQKEVTALCANKDHSRVLAGGLDGLVKIYDTSNWKVVHGVKYPAAILSMSLSPDEKHIAVGMSTALLSLRSRVAAKPLPVKSIATFPVFHDEFVFREKRTKALKDYDRALAGFRFGDALDLVLKGGDSILILTILNEIKHRSAFPQALQNRSPETLLPILRWMHKNLGDPRYAPIIIDLTYQILDIYGADLVEDKEVAYVIEGITRKIRKEIDQANTSQILIGLLSMAS